MLETGLALASEAALTMGLSVAGTWLGLRLTRPPPLEGHWTVRARHTWAARRGGSLAFLVAALFAMLVVPMLAGSHGAPWALRVPVLLAAAWWPARELARRRDYELSAPSPSLKAFKAGRRALLLALYGHVVALFALAIVALFLPWWASLLGIALGVAASLAFSHGAGVDLAARLGWAHAADPELVALVRSRPGGDKVTAVHVLEVHHANALALPLAGRLAVTRGLLDHLDEAGLAGILDHELGHLAEPPGVVRARVAMLLSLCPLVAIGPLTLAFGAPAFFGLLVAVFLVLRLGRRLRTRMEERADAHAHEDDPATYARALEALHRVNGIPAVLSRPPHPDLYDRMVAAGVEPDWPRPEKPDVWRPRLAAGGAMLLMAVFIVPLRVVLSLLSTLPGLGWIWGGPY